MLQLSKSEAREASNHPLHWSPERGAAPEGLKREGVKPLAFLFVNPDKTFLIRKDASHYARGAVLEHFDEKGNHYPVAFWLGVLTPSPGNS